MNIRRGIFRVWLLGSAGWAVLIAYEALDRIREPYLPPHKYIYNGSTDTIGRLSEEESSRIGFALLTEYDELPLRNSVTLYVPRAVDIEVTRPRVQEFNRAVPPTRSEEMDEARWKAILDATQLALVPIFATFAMGLSFLWIAAGFKS